MGKGILTIRKERLKQGLMKGQSIRKSMLEAGYSERTAHGNCDKNEPIVKACIDEIMAEFKATDITVEYVLKNLREDRELARIKGDIATMRNVDDLLGRYLAMFTDKQEVKQESTLTIDQKNYILNRIKGLTPVTQELVKDKI
jgi:hypothetical protein